MLSDIGARLLCSFLTGGLLHASLVVGDKVQWSGDLRNLEYSALGPKQVRLLSVLYAEDVASALGVDAADVMDLKGRPGHVSLRAVTWEDAAAQNSSNSSSNSSSTIQVVTTTQVATSSTVMVTTTTSATSTETATTTATTTVISSLPPLAPLRGIAYGALPCTEVSCAKTGWVSEDMVQDVYSKQWGADGRDDLGTMVSLGANAVRLYHSMGLNVKRDHGGFLDRAQAVGLNVMAGYDIHGYCPDFDCFETWKTSTLQGFDLGFRQGDGWHPAVSALILLNEPDFFGGYPDCKPSGAWCRVKAMLSAMDGILAAEREAGVQPGRVKLTVTWSFGMMPSIDGKEGGPGLFGFQDTVAGIANPQIANYTPRSTLADLQDAFTKRWIHGVNTQAPWSFVKSVIANNYAKFAPIPWFIGEYGANGQSQATIQADLEDMQKTAEEDDNFLGAAFFQFQTAHFKGGSELNFGLFRLGSEKLWDMSPPCDDEDQSKCPTWPVYCLSKDLNWLPGAMAHRAQALAAAWGGIVPSGRGFCHDGGRQLSLASASDQEATRLACEIRVAPERALDIQKRLQADSFADSFSVSLARSTKAVLGDDDTAILGDLLLEKPSMTVIQESTDDATDQPSKQWALPVVVVALLTVASGLAIALVLSKKKVRGGAQTPRTVRSETSQTPKLEQV